MAENVTIRGQEKVLAHLKKLSNPAETFDSTILNVAARSRAEFAEATLSKRPASTSISTGGQDFTIKNMRTGDVARAWSNPFKITGGYKITNDKKSADGKWLIADLLDKGHGTIYPKGKALYIPLTRKGQGKSYGAKPTGLNFGEDYIYLKKVNPVKGRFFMKKITKKASTALTRDLIKAIRRVFT